MFFSNKAIFIVTDSPQVIWTSRSTSIWKSVTHIYRQWRSSWEI